MVDDPVDVAVELPIPRSVGEVAHRREASRDDLLGVVGEREFGAAFDRGSSGEQFVEGHAVLGRTTLGQAERSHPQGGDAAGPRVRLGGRCGSGEQEAAAGRVMVDEATHRVEHAGDALPFVDQQRCRIAPDDRRVGLDDLTLGCDVESADRSAPLCRGGRLADTFRAVEQQRWQLREQLVDFVVDDAPHI